MVIGNIPKYINVYTKISFFHLLLIFILTENKIMNVAKNDNIYDKENITYGLYIIKIIATYERILTLLILLFKNNLFNVTPIKRINALVEGDWKIQ